MLSRVQILNIRFTGLKIHSKRYLSYDFSKPLRNISSPKDIYSRNLTLMSCFRRGDVESARRVFDEMPKRNLITWNCMISGYVLNRRLREAQEMFDIMPKKNVVSWTALLTGYVKFGMLGEARSLFDEMPERNVVCRNSLISGYINTGELGKARELFDEMPVRNSASWSIMIHGYLYQNLFSEAQGLFAKAPNKTTKLYNAFLYAYVNLGYMQDASNVFNQMPQKDEASWTTMIMGYSRAGNMKSAKALFQQMPGQCLEACTAIIWGYMHIGDAASAQLIFDKMSSRDVVLWNTIIGGYVRNNMLETASKVFMEMPERDIHSWNLILLGHVREENMVNALNFFEKMPQWDQTSWNTLISGYQNVEVFTLFSRMIREGFKPNQGTLTAAISVCASLASLGWGQALHLCAIRSGYEHDAKVVSSLISMYSKCGSINKASDVFKNTSSQDTVTWNAMIVALAHSGFSDQALKLFPCMVQSGLKPDHVTFLGLLSACAHKGLVRSGLEIINTMQSDWKLIPKSEHYNCLVDLLGRSGRLSEAYELVNQMPVDVTAYSWEVLLSACIIHGNLDLAEIVARKILDVKPLDGGVYVLLSNIYASKGKWKDSTRIRELMKENGAIKEQACSWIEVKGEINAFVSSDTAHLQSTDIYKELETLSLIMEEAKQSFC